MLIILRIITEGILMPIDHEQLNILYSIQPDNEPDFVKNILQIYLTSTEENIALLESGYRQDDLELMTRAAHTIKSSSANIGATKLTNICRELENTCRMSAESLSAVKIDVIKSEFKRVETYLNKHILLSS